MLLLDSPDEQIQKTYGSGIVLANVNVHVSINVF